MRVARRLERLERLHRDMSSCPLCVRGLGVRWSVIMETDDSPVRAQYACPICDAAPGHLRVVRIMFDDDDNLTPEQAMEREQQRAVHRFLAAGPADGPRARAVAALNTGRENRGGTDAAGSTQSRRT